MGSDGNEMGHGKRSCSWLPVSLTRSGRRKLGECRHYGESTPCGARARLKTGGESPRRQSGPACYGVLFHVKQMSTTSGRLIQIHAPGRPAKALDTSAGGFA